MKAKIAVGVVVIAGVLGYLFYQLGGLDNVEITIEVVEEYHIAGIAYQGKYNDYRLKDIYFKVKEKLDETTVKGEMIVINYRLSADSTEHGWVRQFVGVLVKDAKTKVEELSLVILPAGKVLRAKISAHNLVMPKPDRIEELVKQKASEQNALVGGYTLERYASDRELIIDTPLIE